MEKTLTIHKFCRGSKSILPPGDTNDYKLIAYLQAPDMYLNCKHSQPYILIPILYLQQYNRKSELLSRF